MHSQGFLFRPRNMKSVHLETDAIEALVDGDVQHAALVTDPKVHVAGHPLRLLAVLPRGAGWYERDLLAGRIDYHDHRPLEATRGQIDVPLYIDRHAVAAVFFAKVHQGLSGASDQAIGS